MYREISGKLEKWKRKKKKKPLLVIGPRQVGKTYSCREFAYASYQKVLEINFQDDIRARNYFAKPRSTEDIITYIELNYIGTKLDKDTLIFFDEIQLVPELITALKFLSEKCQSDFLCSGSMLGVYISGTSSFPVGYVETLNMHPMSFEEFLAASGMDLQYIASAKECVRGFEPVQEALHDRLNGLFSAYLVCGGMPEAVDAYASEGIAAAVAVNRRLSNDFEMDIAHYADAKTRIKAIECYRSLPIQLAKENRKFQYKLVKDGYNARYFEESLSWLKSAGLINCVHRLKAIDSPLEINKEPGVFKAYMFDTGLLLSHFADSIISDALDDSLRVYKGVLYENVTAQTLFSKDIPCFYYEPNTSSEIDFVIERSGRDCPIEVKGGLHTRSKSFSNYIKNHACREAYRFSKKNAGISDDGIVRYLPHYAMEWVL